MSRRRHNRRDHRATVSEPSGNLFPLEVPYYPCESRREPLPSCPHRDHRGRDRHRARGSPGSNTDLRPAPRRRLLRHDHRARHGLADPSGSTPGPRRRDGGRGAHRAIRRSDHLSRRSPRRVYPLPAAVPGEPRSTGGRTRRLRHRLRRHQDMGLRRPGVPDPAGGRDCPADRGHRRRRLPHLRRDRVPPHRGAPACGGPRAVPGAG